MVHEQDAVEVVDFVLHGACTESGRFDRHAVPRERRRLHDDARRAVHVTVDVRNREASLLIPYGALSFDDHRVDQHDRLFSFSGVDYRNALGGPDLIGGEPDPLLRAHRIEQVRDQLSHVVVDLRHFG